MPYPMTKELRSEIQEGDTIFYCDRHDEWYAGVCDFHYVPLPFEKGHFLIVTGPGVYWLKVHTDNVLSGDQYASLALVS